ncbi:MAG: DUF2336 domain-containing protein [Rhodospirillales bacterium]|nr:DUF2336 domain-containing protein [Rhodospirillales bacterium]MCB9995047.1 DUF2336 domain-containing protein [Rhodospirillales bacterium]
MKTLLQKLSAALSGSSKKDPDRYEREKTIARGDDLKARVSLAGDSKTHQEILYYLAEHDTSEAVKKALVKNPSTPVQASPILAGDKNEDIRMALAERLVKLLPELNSERHSQLYAFAVQALGTLALDEVLKIRKALSTALKDFGEAPPDVVSQLAKDIERDVSEPILKFCTAVPDDVLLEILKTHPASWAVQAIAGRRKVSKLLSQAVIDTGDKPGGTTLIKNNGAEITNATLEQIIERAKDYPEWQTHLASRAGLPPKMAKRLAKYADRSVRDLLLKRTDFDPKDAEEIAEVFKRRLDFAGEGDALADQSAEQRVKKLHKQGKLTEDIVADALAMRDREFVCAAMACLAGTDSATVEKIFGMKAGKPIVALTWKAKLTMRFALRLQKEMGHVQPKELVYPRDGTDYPLTHDEMVWQLDFLGIKAG